MAVYRLITFGGLSLEQDGQPVKALEGQRRALGLLAVLACAQPRGVARDRLMLLFWPESNMSRARGSLKQLLHMVRRQLGNADVIVGVTDLHLQSDQITSDVAEFRDRIAAGDDEAAARLYAGPFLDGVFLDGCDEFERWAADERASLATARAACLERLALAAEADDRVAAAVHWWRELRTAEPLSARAHASVLREELGAPPDAEVVACADSITRPATTVTRASPAVAGSDHAAEPATGTGIVAPAKPHRSRRLRLAAGIMPFFVVAAAAILMIRRSASDSADTVLLPNRVAVAIFVNRTGSPQLDALGTMTSDWVARGLTRVPGADVFDVGGLYVRGRSPGGEPVGPRELARRNGAGIVVAGNYYQSGDTLTFSAQVIDVASGRILRALDPIRARTDAPLDAVEEVRQRVEVALSSILDPRASEFASPAMAPPRYDSFAEYVAGQELYWQGDWTGSLPLFRKAAALDTTFTAALTYLGVAGVGTARCDLADSVLRVLTDRRPGVPTIELLTARISVARCASDHREHNRLQREKAALMPGSKLVQLTMSTGYRQLNQPAEALAILSNIDPARDLGWLPDRGRSFFWRELAASQHALGGEALDLLESLAHANPQNVDFQGQIGIVAARSGDVETAQRIDEWLADRTHVFPPSLPILYRAGIAAVRGDTSAAMHLIRSLPQEAHPYDFLQFHVDPAFTSLRDNETFRRFLVPRG